MGIQLGQQCILVEHLSILCATRQVCDAQFLLLLQWRLVWNLQAMQNELREGAEESTIRAALDLQEEETINKYYNLGNISTHSHNGRVVEQSKDHARKQRQHNIAEADAFALHITQCPDGTLAKCFEGITEWGVIRICLPDEYLHICIKGSWMGLIDKERGVEIEEVTEMMIHIVGGINLQDECGCIHDQITCAAFEHRLWQSIKITQLRTPRLQSGSNVIHFGIELGAI